MVIYLISEAIYTERILGDDKIQHLSLAFVLPIDADAVLLTMMI